MTRWSWIVCAVILARSHMAAADEADAIKKVVIAQADAITQGDMDAFAKTIAASDVFVIVPGGYATSADEAKQVIAHAWPKGSTGVTAVQINPGSHGDVAWATSNLDFLATGDLGSATVGYRVTELLTREGGSWKVHAMIFSTDRGDNPRDWANGEYATRDKPPGTEAKNAPLARWLAHTTDLAAHMRSGVDAVVIASRLDHGEGPYAKKILRAWKAFTFTPAWIRAGGDGKTYAWLAARVSHQVKVEDKMLDDPQWVMVTAVKGAHDWEIVGVHYTQVEPY